MNPLRNFARKAIRGYRILATQQMQSYPPEMQQAGGTPQMQQPMPTFSPVPQQIQVPVTVMPRVAQIPINVETININQSGRHIDMEGVEIHHLKPKAIEKIEGPKQSLVYPLIPESPQKGQHVMAYTKIFWDNKESRYMYELYEPQLTKKLETILGKIRDLLEQRLDVDFAKLKLNEASDYLNKHTAELLRFFKYDTTEEERAVLTYYIDRDFIGLGKLEALMKDKNIEDISCDGVGIPIFIFHRNPDIGSVITNISFKDNEELDSFITRLAQISGKVISVAEPLLDSALPNGSRLQATLGTDIARRGSNFTIRKFTEEPLTPVHLIKYGTLDSLSLAYLWMAVDYGKNILVSGGTASGKSTLLNVLSLFIRPDKKIISIEDTAELKLPHPHWVPSVARTTISTGTRGEVGMFDLLRESLRQRPDYIIVGEVRGSEAFVLFQEMATGHPSFSTIHAENMPKLMDRLTTQPISLPPSLISSLDIIVFMQRTIHAGKFMRRMTEAVEMIDFSQGSQSPIVNTLFKWNPVNDKFDVAEKSIMLKKISVSTGIKPEHLVEELESRKAVLEWMADNNILDYERVYKMITMYYNYPERVLSMVTGGG